MRNAGWTEGEARVDGLRLRFRESGSGPLILMLHGFPDAPETWRFQRDALVGAGFRVVTPWLRGYGTSAKPKRVRDYAVRALVADAIGLVRALGEARAAAIVGHDWGGVIGWRIAADHPAAIERLIILNAPHPAAFARELRRVEQHLRSIYAAFFQLPWLPELLLQARGMALVRRSIERLVRRPAAFTDADWDAIRAALGEPGALRAALAYYRAMGRAYLRGRSESIGPLGRIEHSTLLLWGERDAALSARLSHGLERWVPAITVRRFPDAGHWVHWDEPDAVRRAMLEFLGRRPAAA